MASLLQTEERRKARPAGRTSANTLHPERQTQFEADRDARIAGRTGARVDHLSEAEQRKLLFGD